MKFVSDDITNNFDEEYLNMDISESPVAEWSKEDEYNNWFVQFDNIESGEDFEVIGNGGEGDTNEGGDDN